MAKPHTVFSLIRSSNRKNGMGKQGTTLIEVSENTTISVSSLQKDKLTIAAVFPQAFSASQGSQAIQTGLRTVPLCAEGLIDAE